MSQTQEQNNPTVFVREVLLTLWCRQKALLQCLEEKGMVEEKEYSEKLNLHLEQLVKPFLQQ
ncbi:MAG: hypothetical protein D6785_12060 [Planctomycetota bacterium]|nr:MAG: hypothetical protein D6785_12060 [Planctomycetota bacterium]